jgi:hypothetical protein
MKRTAWPVFYFTEAGETLRDKIEAQLAAIKRMPQLVRSSFQASTVAYITGR